MPYNLKLIPKSDYLYATVQGDNSPANIQHYLLEVQHACEVNDCRKVLIEENLRGPTIGTFDIFDVVTKLSQDAARAKLKIAYVSVTRRHDMSAMRFAESAARNRSVNIRMFFNFKEAEDWLLTGGQIDRPVKG
jgi:hypothetical protein